MNKDDNIFPWKYLSSYRFRKIEPRIHLEFELYSITACCYIETICLSTLHCLCVDFQEPKSVDLACKKEQIQVPYRRLLNHKADLLDPAIGRK